MILATDGLWNFVTPAEAAEVCHGCTLIQEIAKRLVDAALAANSGDNVTVAALSIADD